MRGKRNPVKQIMSDVHRDVRAGKVELSGHQGFLREVKRRVRAAGLPEKEIHEMVARRERDASGERPDR
jgi:hypothetical protein